MTTTSAHAASTYQAVEVTSRTPLELIVMLYDGGLAAMTQARDALERGDLRAKAPALSKALAIVHALQSSLDPDVGGDVAQTLDRLYGYVSDRLVEANVRKDPAPIDEALHIFTSLRDAWARIAVDPVARAS
jgi:flagellar protein FliS